MLRANVRQLRQLPPTAVLSAIVPEGRGSIEAVGALVSWVAADGWAPRDGVCVVALDFDAGQRVAFGREGAPEVPLASA